MKLKKCAYTKMYFPLEFFGKNKNTKDGYAGHSKIGMLWANVSQRSVNGRYASCRSLHYPNNSHHRNGVRMYEPWVNDPAAFAWYILTELGYPEYRNGEKLTLDRIDNDGDYVPGNLRWATPLEQYENRSVPRRWAA